MLDQDICKLKLQHVESLKSLESQLMSDFEAEKIVLRSTWMESIDLESAALNSTAHKVLSESFETLQMAYDADKQKWLDKIATLEERLTTRVEEFAELQLSFATAERAVEDSEAALRSAEVERQDAHAKLESTLALVDRFSAEATELREQSRQLESEVVSARIELSAALVQHRRLEQELASAQQSAASEAQQLKRLMNDEHASAVERALDARDVEWEVKLAAAKTQFEASYATQLEILRAEYKQSLVISLQEHEKMLQQKLESGTNEKIEHILKFLQSQTTLEQTRTFIEGKKHY